KETTVRLINLSCYDLRTYRYTKKPRLHDRVEGDELADTARRPLVHARLESAFLAGLVERVEEDAVVNALNNLLLAAPHLDESDAIVRHLDVLRHCPLPELLHLQGVDVTVLPCLRHGHRRGGHDDGGNDDADADDKEEAGRHG
uniref:Uncharacterized protein n=1 Tax=Triticum urartu TaxID=4572 RepID=A0A8R7Q7X5_TRIUA